MIKRLADGGDPSSWCWPKALIHTMLPNPQSIPSSTFKPPPLDESLTFPELFDYNAIHSPKHPLFRYDDPDNGGFRTILWEEAVTAFHIAGHYFKKYVHGDAPITVGILANASKPVVP